MVGDIEINRWQDKLKVGDIVDVIAYTTIESTGKYGDNRQHFKSDLACWTRAQVMKIETVDKESAEYKQAVATENDKYVASLKKTLPLLTLSYLA